MRRRREVGDRQHVAGQPAPVVHQPADIVEVILDVARPGLDLLALGIAGLGELLVHPLVDQVRRHLVVELVVEPGGEPARLGPERRALRQQRRLGLGLLEILEDRRRIRQHQVVDPQHRHLSRGVHPQEVHPPFPRPLLDQLDLDLLLGQHQADLAAERGQRLMVETAHFVPFFCSMLLHRSFGPIISTADRAPTQLIVFGRPSPPVLAGLRARSGISMAPARSVDRPQPTNRTRLRASRPPQERAHHLHQLLRAEGLGEDRHVQRSPAAANPGRSRWRRRTGSAAGEVPPPARPPAIPPGWRRAAPRPARPPRTTAARSSGSSPAR